jgi:hypothetical protein
VRIVNEIGVTALDGHANREVAVIKFLAQLFRGFHYIVGISEPAPGTSDRAFVFAWLASIAFIVAFCIILFYYIVPFIVRF